MPHRTDRPRHTSAAAELTAPPLPAQPTAVPPFDPRSAAAVAGLSDRRVRNAWITQRYHELAGQLTPSLGREHTYCTFARWRSAALGAALGADDADVETARVVRRLADHEAATFAWAAPRFEALVQALSTGAPAAPDREATLRRLGLVDDGPLARVAFGQLLAAVDDTDPVRRAQRVLAANLLLVWREQVELQSLVAPPVEPRRRWLRRSARVARRATHTAAVLDRVVLRVPGPRGVIDLVADAPFDYPAPLQVPSTSVLVETLDLWAPSSGSADIGHDGLDLACRMRSLERLHRAGQHDHELAVSPFGPRQLEAMRRLEVPRVVADAGRR